MGINGRRGPEQGPNIEAIPGRVIKQAGYAGDGLFLVVLTSFFALIPAGPAYAGTFDAAAVFGLKALDVTGGAALSFALLVRAVLFIPITLVGLILVVVRYGGWKAVRRARR